MHVDWDWIKQRPHFLAEQLSARFSVTVVYPFSRGRSRLTRTPRAGLRMRPVVGIPFKYVFPALYRLNRLYQRAYIGLLIRLIRPDVIWLTHPFCADLVPSKLACHLVYDCMDDAQALTVGRPFAKKCALSLERSLIKRSDLVFVSSAHLADVLDERELCREKTILLRNAYDGKLHQPESHAGAGGRPYRIGYIGTIASWMDFDSILHALENVPDIEFVFFGPKDADLVTPHHERLKFAGPVPHSQLHEAVRDIDCLIMPFKVNDVVLSVDPVKLYEYINFNKPIISVLYDEVVRFSPFVSFYSDQSGLASAINELKASGFRPKYGPVEREQFLQENTWDVRGRVVAESLERLI